MSKFKSTKHALVMSILALVVCISMLVGSTFAWFTDSVTSGRNQIVAGNLDVIMEYKTPGSNDWSEVTSDTVLFGEKGLWEPGHTEVVALRIRNQGTLAFKYDISTTVYEEVSGTNVYGNEFKLSDHLVVKSFCYGEDALDVDWMTQNFLTSRTPSFIMEEQEFNASMSNQGSQQTICPGEAGHIYYLSISMPETVGNEANYKTGTTAPSISFGVTLMATQFNYEDDSFNNQYDKNAKYPEIIYVNNADELRTAIKNASNEATIYMTAGTYTIADQINIDGKSINIVGLGDVTVKLSNSGKKAFYIYGSKVEGNTGINVTISNIKIDGNNAKSDIWVRTWEKGVRGDVNLTLDNVTCTSIISDNNYDDNTVINIDVKKSTIGKITLDAAPYNNNGHTTYTNLTYDNASTISSIMIQNAINDDGMAHITINGAAVTARGEQIK